MEETLIKRAQKGDKESFSKIILQIKDEAYKIAYCYLRDENDSIDAVCDAVEKALLNIRKLKQPKYFKTWFMRIVINECKMQLREKQKVIHSADELYESEDRRGATSEDGIDLKECLKKLSENDRILIYMKYYMGYTLEEIAESTGIPTGTVKTKIYSNLKLLRKQLEVKEV